MKVRSSAGELIHWGGSGSVCGGLEQGIAVRVLESLWCVYVCVCVRVCALSVKSVISAPWRTRLTYLRATLARCCALRSDWNPRLVGTCAGELFFSPTEAVQAGSF